MMEIQTALTDEQIRGCFDAIKQLRPRLDETGFITQVRRQMENHGYSPVFIAE